MEVHLSGLISLCQGPGLKASLDLCVKQIKDVEYDDGIFGMRQCKELFNLNMTEEFNQ